MKVWIPIVLFSPALLFITSCDEKDDELQLLSKWHLIEQLADPGDGSGTFQPVTSNKTVEFLEDGTLTSNGNLCNMDLQVGDGSTGTYSLADSTILPNNCGFAPPFPMTFEIQNGFLIINYPCIEPCREKYEQVD